MQYSTTNLIVSIQRQFADLLKEAGYNVRFHTTGEVETFTKVGLEEALGTITLVPEFPGNPALLTRSSGLNDGSTPGEGEVLIPAFAISFPDEAKRIRRDGIGSSVFERWRTVFIDGFAYDEFQQRELTDLLYEWLQIGDPLMSVWDYSDPEDVQELRRCDVVGADVMKDEWITEIEAIRYFIHAKAILSYFE